VHEYVEYTGEKDRGGTGRVVNHRNGTTNWMAIDLKAAARRLDEAESAPTSTNDMHAGQTAMFETG